MWQHLKLITRGAEFHGFYTWVNVKSPKGRQAKLDLQSATGFARGYLLLLFNKRRVVELPLVIKGQKSPAL